MAEPEAQPEAQPEEGLVSLSDHLTGRLRAAFDEPSTFLPSPRQARAAGLLRAAALDAISQAARATDVRVLLVKGEALARTVYPSPWMRSMSDTDLLVRAADQTRFSEGLRRAGLERMPAPVGRSLSGFMLNEVVWGFRVGRALWPVEVHSSLDKLVRRPTDDKAIFRRAQLLPKSNLYAPCLEDHLLLVVLHAAASDFRHEVAWLDLQRLINAGADLQVAAERARQWRLASATHVALQTMAHLDPELVAHELIDALKPARWRLRAIRRHLLEHHSSEAQPRMGLAWVLRQTPLRDDLSRWALGVAQYATLRMADRIADRLRQAPSRRG